MKFLEHFFVKTQKDKVEELYGQKGFFPRGSKSEGSKIDPQNTVFIKISCEDTL